MTEKEVYESLRILAALGRLGTTELEELAKEVHKMIRAAEDSAYVRGGETSRRLLRLHLGLATEADHKERN